MHQFNNDHEYHALSNDDLRSLIVNKSNHQDLKPTAAAEREVIRYMDLGIHHLDITEKQRETATRVHDEITDHLTSKNALLYQFDLELFVQGSFLQDLVVRPSGATVVDVDLVCRIDSSELSPRDFFTKLTADLQGYQSTGVSPKSRCVQLDIGKTLKFDVIPVFTETPGNHERLLVPDQKLERLFPTSPRLFAAWLDRKADLVPVMIMNKRSRVEAMNASVVRDFPETDGINKKPLKRFIQLAKAHRNRFFERAKPPVSSIVITTLCCHAYEKSVTSLHTDSYLLHLLNSLRMLPEFIKIVDGPERKQYEVVNPVESRENFTEHWNDTTYRDFLRWNKDLVESIEIFLIKTVNMPGLSDTMVSLSAILGDEAVKKATNAVSSQSAVAVQRGKLGVVGPSLLIAISENAVANPVPRHTFDGIQ